MSAPHLLEFGDEVVNHGFHLECLGGEEDKLLAGEIELQHVLGGDGNEQDLTIAGGKGKVGLDAKLRNVEHWCF